MDESTWRFGLYTVVWPNNNIIFSLGLLIFWSSASEVTTLWRYTNLFIIIIIIIIITRARICARYARVVYVYTRNQECLG